MQTPLFVAGDEIHHWLFPVRGKIILSSGRTVPMDYTFKWGKFIQETPRGIVLVGPVHSVESEQYFEFLVHWDDWKLRNVHPLHRHRMKERIDAPPYVALRIGEFYRFCAIVYRMLSPEYQGYGYGFVNGFFHGIEDMGFLFHGIPPGFSESWAFHLSPEECNRVITSDLS